MRDETLAIHAGYEPDPTTHAVAVPIYQTVAYQFDNAQHGADLFNLAVPGNIYTRIMNPTNDVLEKRVAALENGIAGLALSAGSAAVNYSILTIAEAGNNVVSVPLLYGGTYTLFAHMLPKQGIEVRFADDDSPASLERLIDGKTIAVFAETIGNPAGNIADIEAISDMAHSHGVPVIVDSTVTPPPLLKPIDYGVDIVVHSMTKYMGGHGNSLGGVIVDSGKFPWTEHAAKFPGLTRAGTGLSWHRVQRRPRPRGLHRAGAHRAAAQHRFGAQPVQRLPAAAGSRNPAAAHGAPRRQRHGGGQALAVARPGRVGAVRRAAGFQVLRPGPEVHQRPAFGACSALASRAATTPA